MAHKHDHDCDCDHHDSHGGGGFALGVAIGAAAAILLAPDDVSKVRQKARKKLDELTGGRAPEALLDSLKELVGQVISDIQQSGEPKAKPRKRVARKKK